MAVELQTSAIYETVKKVSTSPGSPYFIIQAVVHAGGKDLAPLQLTRHDVARFYKSSFMDDSSLVLLIGLGTLVNEIGPYQDDLKLTLNISMCDEQAAQLTNEPVLSRTFRAYLGDDIPRSAEAGNSPILQDTETANRADAKHIRFILEEVAVEQLRKFQVGIVARSCPPFEVMRTLLVKACQALKLGKDEVITGFDLVPANNVTPRDHVVIRDGECILEVPDILQNKQGGIYSTGLGFYIQGRSIYTWPVYDTTRQDTAKRVLTIVLAPSRHSKVLDKTWSNDGRMVTIYSAGDVKVIDDSLGQLNIHGNGTRFADAGKLLDGFATVDGNKATISRSKNNSEYVTTVVGNGQNLAPRSKAQTTSNIYLETSKLAKRSGATMHVPWVRSNPELLTPGMAVEILYDYNGLIKTIPGVLLDAIHSYALDGQGLAADRYTATSGLAVFIDRNDPAYLDYIKGGGTLNPTPDVGNI